MIIKLADQSRYGKKAYLKPAEEGKWFKFSVTSIGEDMIGYGKIVKIENGYAEVEKYFELPSYRPYAAHKWFDNLPFAI